MSFFVEAVATTATDQSNYQSVSDFWLFVVYCLVVIVVVIFFSFYFNRVLGQIVTFFVNQYTWRRYNAYIEVESFRVSILGGRILFKNLRYLSTNQSISILKGHITVRYWLLNVRKSEDDKNGKAGHLPCRIACEMEGVEWFFYNNAPAYNRMKDILGLSSTETYDSKEPIIEDNKTNINGILDPENQTPINVDTSLMERLLPIQFECTAGAIMIGNTELNSMLVCKLTQATGTYSITKSRSHLDYYKSVIDVMLTKPQVSLKENMDYNGTGVDFGQIPDPPPDSLFTEFILKPLNYLYPFIHTRQYGKMQHVNDIMREAGKEGSYKSTNTKYREHYARVTNVIEANEMFVSYYADYAGLVPSQDPQISYSTIGTDIGNGGLPPEWGVKMSVWDAIIHYGPWTDKERSQIQDYFFPNPHRENIPTKRLRPGQQRVATSFDTYIEFMTEGKLRIPTRESSKDWKYTGNISDIDIGSDGFCTRPYGWLNIKAGEGSYVKVTTAFACDISGFKNTVDIVLKETDVTSSVNYASFLESKRVDISIEMPSPLQWNGYRHWKFKINAKEPIIYLLRDHIYLMQDLIKDWTSSPPVDLLHFTPMKYQLLFSFEKPTVYLCVNEHNIINNPNSIEDNAYFKVQAYRVSADVVLPFVQYQPETTSITFNVNAEQASVGLSLQTSHTFSSFMKPKDENMAVAVNISLSGNYEAYNTVDISRHIESCNLDIKIKGATVKMFGTVIRYILILKDNYFGAWNHFSTIDEYRKHTNNPQEWLEQTKRQMDSKPPSDPFEVYLLLELEDGVMLLPENLYECSNYSQIEFQELQLELRNLDVYLDMYLTISPITLSKDINPKSQSKEGIFRIKSARDPKNYLYIDGINVYGHRLFGPVPECLTYLCHWKVDVGRITGEVKLPFLLGLAGFGQTFAYNLIDEDNAVPQEMKSKDLPDVTFAKVHLSEIDVSLMSMNSATNFSLKDGLLLEFDNLINVKYSQRITIKIPTISTRFLANPEQARGHVSSEEDEYSWVEVAKADLGLNITVFRHTASWEEDRNNQQNFIRSQDYPTRRCARLYQEPDSTSQLSLVSAKSIHEHHVGVLYAPPFRPFMFGRVEDKSVLYDPNYYMPQTPTSDHIRYANYSSSGSLASSIHDSLGDVNIQEEFDRMSFKALSTKSGVSRDNDSFHTAIESEYDDIYNELEDSYSMSSRNDSDVTTDDELYIHNTIEDENNPNKKKLPDKHLTAAIPPSIPYSDYLNRYKIRKAHSDFNQNDFFYPFTPPSHPEFIPEKDFEEKNRPLYQSTDFSSKDHFSNDSAGVPYFDSTSDFADDASKNGNEVTATTIVEATKPVTVLVTPIIIKIIQELTEEIVKDEWDLDSMLDGLQMEYVEQLTRFLTNQYICTRFAIILPQTYLHFIQNVTVPDNLPSYEHGEAFIQTKYNSKDTVLCSADIFFNELKIIGSVKFEDRAYNDKKDKVAESRLALQEARFHLDMKDMGSTVKYISKQYDRSLFSFGIPYDYIKNRKLYKQSNEKDILTNELVVLDIAINGFDFKLLGAKMPNYLNLNVGKIDSVIITESVEILVGAVYSWLVFVDDLKGILESFNDKRSKQIQLFIHEIAKQSASSAVIGDPIFLTTPTTMLRLGSGNFRNDCGWKLLARMRHCLHNILPSQREELQYNLTKGDALQGIKQDSMYTDVVKNFSCWRSWEIGSDDINHCRLFTQPFGQKITEVDDVVNTTTADTIIDFLTNQSNFAKLRLEGFMFTIYEESIDTYRDKNSIFIGPSKLFMECIFHKGKNILSSENIQSETSHRLMGLSDDYVDITSKISVGDIKVTVNPIIMAFAQHMILVQRVFTDKILKLQHATKLSKTSNAQKIQNESQLSSSPGTTTNNHEFDINSVLNRVGIVAHALVSLNKISVAAHAQKLTMDAAVSGIQGSILYSNPVLSTLPLIPYLDRDSDGGSGKRSSTRAGRKTVSTDPRLVLDSACGINSIAIKFSEGTSSDSESSSDSTSTSKSTRPSNNNTLLKIMLDKANVNANVTQVVKNSKKYNKADTTKNILNVFSNIHGFHIHIPQSLLKLYGFIESWQAEQGRRFNFLFQNLVKEWEEQKKEQVTVSTSSPLDLDSSIASGPAPGPIIKKMDIKLQFLLNEFKVKADLLPSLSIEYRIYDFFVMVNETYQKSLPVHMYSFQLSKQEIHLLTKDSKKGKQKTSNSDVPNTFSIPGIHSTGSLKTEIVKGVTQMKLRSIISVDTISMSLNASIIDSILTAQSLLGSEVSELIDVLTYSKQKSNHSSNIPKNHTAVINPDRVFKYAIDVSLDGLRVSASSPSAICMFTSNALEASISNDSVQDRLSPDISNPLTWKLQAKNFVLSLDHNTVEGMNSEGHDTDNKRRRNCLAYILVDFSVQSSLKICSIEGCNKETHVHVVDNNLDAIFVDISRIQTVMQPIALGKLAEMFIYYDTELKKKKKIKKGEMDQLTKNTKRLVENILPKNEWQKTLHDEPQSLLLNKIISLHIRRIGIAIPLDARSDLPSSETARGVEALLLSVASIEFLTKNIEQGALQLDSVTLQFVKKFDQSKSDHFIADNHYRMNHITFPSASCHVSASKYETLQVIKANANVGGFDVDIDGTIADYLNTLSGIYVTCKDRVDAFNFKTDLDSTENTNAVLPSPSTEVDLKSEKESDMNSEVVNLKVECRFNCNSGIIRMYPKKHSSDTSKVKKKTRTSRFRTGFDLKTSEVHMAVVEIPGLGAWIAYETSLGAHATDAPKRFHSDILIRESRNTLHPALVQFLNEVVAGLKLGIQQSSERKAVRSTSSATESNMNISLFLRLSKTQLDLTCQPTSKVVCSLGWEESEFLMNAFSNDATSRTMSCVGSLREITSVIKHHFSPEACLNARVDQILFNAMLTSQRRDGGKDDDISIAIEIPNVLGDINMRHLQDLLILNSCWFDQHMAYDSQASEDSQELTIVPANSIEEAGTDSTLVNSPPFSKHVALLIKNMKFSADLGQNIGKISFIPTSLWIQMHHSPFESKGISLSLDDIKIISEGRLSGSADFKRTVMEARIDQSIVNGDNKEKASACIKSEGFSGSFEYEYQNILDVIQQSLELNVDYLRRADKYELRVYTQLEALIVRLSIKTVPVIITMVQKFNELLQKKKAEAGIRSDSNVQDSLDLKKSASSKSIYQTDTKKHIYETSTIDSQVLVLIKAVEIVIYPSQFQDSDNVDIRANQFKLNLEGYPPNESGVHRKLRATIVSAALAKNVPGKELMVRYSAPLPPPATKPKNLGGTKIFGIPETEIKMDSTQLDRCIEHTFETVFAGRIGVSLNIGLIKYLQEMINMFNTQLDRALDKSPSTGESGTPMSMSSVFEDPEDSSISINSSRRPSLHPESSKSSHKFDLESLHTTPSPSLEITPTLTGFEKVKEETETEAEEKAYKYIPLNSVSFQPQLQVMGDATPPVEWLGLKTERIPGLLHENVTLHLDQLIKVVWKFLESQAD